MCLPSLSFQKHLRVGPLALSGLRSLGGRKSWDLAFNGDKGFLNPWGRLSRTVGSGDHQKCRIKVLESSTNTFSSYETFNTA